MFTRVRRTQKYLGNQYYLHQRAQTNLSETGSSGGPVTGTPPDFKASLKQEWYKTSSSVPIHHKVQTLDFFFKSEVTKWLKPVWTKHFLFRMLSHSVSSDESKPSPALDGKEDKSSFRFNLGQDGERTVKHAVQNPFVYIAPKRVLREKTVTCFRWFTICLPSSSPRFILEPTGSLFKEHYANIATPRVCQDGICL